VFWGYLGIFIERIIHRIFDLLVSLSEFYMGIYGNTKLCLSHCFHLLRIMGLKFFQGEKEFINRTLIFHECNNGNWFGFKL
jgi:hypothetical protein